MGSLAYSKREGRGSSRKNLRVVGGNNYRGKSCACKDEKFHSEMLDSRGNLLVIIQETGPGFCLP